MRAMKAWVKRKGSAAKRYCWDFLLINVEGKNHAKVKPKVLKEYLFQYHYD